MQPKKVLVFILSCFLFPVTVWAQADLPDSSKLVKLRIDPSSAVGAPVSQIFSEVEFIPLETTKESLFGNIQNLRIIDNHFVFFDWDTKSIRIFTLDGKYKGKIDARNLPQESNKKEENNFYGYIVEPLDGVDRIAIYTRKAMMYFDLNGKFIKKLLHESEERKKNVPKTYFKGGGGYVETYHVERRDKDSIYYEIVTVNGDKTTGKYFPYGKDKYQDDDIISNGAGIYNYDVKNELFYLRAHEYNIYLATPDKLYMAYRLIFPFSQSLPADFMTDPQYKKKRFEYMRKNDKKIFAIGNTYLIGDNLFFKTYQWESNQSLKSELIYNFKTGQLTSLVDAQPDSLSQFLPVTDAGLGYDFKSNGFHLFKDGYLYTSYSALVLFNMKEQNAEKKLTYDPRLTKMFKEGSRKSNPVIIKLKPKAN